MTLGQWVGQWFGEWFGSGEPAPEGSLSGTATVGLTCTGPATAVGHLTGGAVITIASAGELSSAVVHPPYVETEYVVSCAARLAVRTSVGAVRLLTKVDGASVLGRVQRIDLFERPKLEARRESKLRSKKAVLRQAASVLTVPRTENVATRALHTVVTTLPDDYVTWNELECMRVLDRKHVVTVKQGAEG